MAHILIIDDDEQVRRMLKQMVESAGHTVTLASDGEIGVNSYKEAPADLVITDILMPNEDGLQAIVKLRKDFRDVKIIAISGGGRVVHTDFLNIALSMGATGALRKPFERKDLLEVIDATLTKDH